MAGRNVLGEIEILRAKLEGTIETRSAELEGEIKTLSAELQSMKWTLVTLIGAAGAVNALIGWFSR